jgi:hypothetical protein
MNAVFCPLRTSIVPYSTSYAYFRYQLFTHL